MKFWIVIRGYKCEKYLSKCLDSIRKQTYKNYRVILILDNSPDGSEKIAQKYKYDKKNPMPIDIHINPVRMGLGYNIWYGIKRCNDADPEDVVCFLDADDWLKKKALSVVSDAYSVDRRILITYGNFYRISMYETTVVSKRTPTAPIRKSKWATSHFKTIKYKLASQLPAKALVHNGVWAPASSDRGLMYAMIEMAGLSRCKKINEVIYNWRDNTPYKTNVKLQKKWDKIFRAMKPFERVDL